VNAAQQSGQPASTSISHVLRFHVGSGEIAGAVAALVARANFVQVDVAGVQDLAQATPMRRDTIFRIASMTKPVTAAAAMILVEEGSALAQWWRRQVDIRFRLRWRSWAWRLGRTNCPSAPTNSWRASLASH
jgi:CubicO group peptidase (beta-lactamase class C family)